MKPELHYSAIGVPAAALSPPATLSPPSSPSVTSPWSPGAAGSSLSAATSSNPSSVSSTSLVQPTTDRFSAFTLVSTCNPDSRLQNLPLTTTAAARGNTFYIYKNVFLFNEGKRKGMWEFNFYSLKIIFLQIFREFHCTIEYRRNG